MLIEKFPSTPSDHKESPMMDSNPLVVGHGSCQGIPELASQHTCW